MVLELHVWGPALELPSIDPDCLAALSYIDHTVAREDWTLMPSNDPAISPDNILPALRHNGTWTSGYLNIVSYLTRYTANSIDNDATQSQRADTLAYASYLTSRGAALIAFSLYVSPSAWANLTRPAYSTLLPFPLTWTVPPGLRAAAIAKTEHLGLHQLAADVNPEDGKSDPKTTGPVTSTGFLRLPKRPGVTEIMQPEQVAAIRLQSLADDFFSVLEELRGPKRYFLSNDKPSSLDFLVFGYLKLIQVKTPHPFLSKCMKKSAAGTRLLRFLEIMHEGPIRWQPGKVDTDLPWIAPTPRGLLEITGKFGGGVVESVPGVGEAWKKYWRGAMKGEDGAQDSTQLIYAAGSALIGVAVLGAMVLFRSLPPFGESIHRFDAHKPERAGLHQFGDIGTIFDNLPDDLETPAKPSKRTTL
ncbi:Tom37 C-terminal domain-containing protein [Pseudomassariella vexata]|uniref:Tom37 C-terminal domain-domain-containing protein n=1 Tax=Pseudomassariella vexata TaxID=1141098 RepID=A0A1Y2D8D5_9PEZI|nr:Tom37 C-terminal domain-containing protein [Pseudomassariella vexata]ORY55518.1 Tom37 C-terminal domain-domain-containing protein [Pseudomassariella vexata]